MNEWGGLAGKRVVIVDVRCVVVSFQGRDP